MDTDKITIKLPNGDVFPAEYIEGDLVGYGDEPPMTQVDRYRYTDESGRRWDVPLAGVSVLVDESEE